MEYLPVQDVLRFNIRETKRQRIEKLFSEHLGQEFSSAYLHSEFGTSVRTRISEINRDERSAVRIKNKSWMERGREASCYWGEKR